jgi:hypothetical protein
MATFEIIKSAFLFEKQDGDSANLGTVPRGTVLKGKLLDSGFIEVSEPVQVKKADGSMAAATGFIFFLGFAGKRQEEVVAMGGTDNEVLCASVTDAAREASTDRDYLLAVAYALSKNLADLGTAAGRAGPFGYTADAWKQATETETGAAKALGVSPEDRLRWYMQPRVAAFVAAAQAKAFKDAVDRPPNFNELFFVQLLGDGAIGILKDKIDGQVAAAVDAAALAPDLAAELKTAPVAVAGVLEKLQARLDAAWDEASKVIALQPPEIRLFRAQDGDSPWMAVAREEMSAGVSEAVTAPLGTSAPPPVPPPAMSVAFPRDHPPPPPPPSTVLPSTPADFSVIAPPLVKPARSFFVQVWIAPSDQREAMLEQALRPGLALVGSRLRISLARDSLITIVLDLPDFEIADAVALLDWKGDIGNVDFKVRAPVHLPPGNYPGSAKLLRDQRPFASILFELAVEPAASAEMPSTVLRSTVRRISRAFASYASQDRAEVLRRVQGMKAVGTDVFVDIVDLRAGGQWEPALYREIKASDGFFLFWSRHAEKSIWVEKEWRYAAENRGKSFISPLPLEDPRLAQPPKDLADKHFNDMILALIKNEDVLKAELGKFTP